MNLGEIRRRVQAKLGDTAGAEVTSQSVADWTNDGIREIARRIGQPQATATTPTVVNQAVYSIATFAADVMRLRSVMLDGSVLESLSIEDADTLLADRERTGQISGQPRWFWIWADSINLWPPPSAVGTLKLFYIKRPPEVAADADVPQVPLHLHPDLVDYVVAQALDSAGEAATAERKLARFDASAREAAADAEWPVRDVYPHVAVALDDAGWV